MQTENTEHKQSANRLTTWLKRLGVAGVIFFTVKGLLWLALPTFLVWFASSN